MSASHKPHPFFKSAKKSQLDHILDFGEEIPKDSTPESVRRIREVMRQIDELTRRIDRLSERY